MKQRMKPNPQEKTGYHSVEHDEDPTCHKTHEGDTPCEPIDEANRIFVDWVMRRQEKR